MCHGVSHRQFCTGSTESPREQQSNVDPFQETEAFCELGDHVRREVLRQEEVHRWEALWKNFLDLRQPKSLLGNFDQNKAKDCMQQNRKSLIDGVSHGLLQAEESPEGAGLKNQRQV